MTPREILIYARSLVSRGWLRDGCARVRPGGHEVDPLHHRAKYFCIYGALIRAGGKSKDYSDEYQAAVALMKKETIGQRVANDEVVAVSIEDFNGWATKKQVLEAFDRAIAAADPQGS